MSYPAIYSNVTRLLRGKKKIRTFIDIYVRPKDHDRVLDIGCGPGDILNFLPDVEYFGFDQDPFYIKSAQKQFGKRGTFFCKAVSRDAFSGNNDFDIILAMGILHHLSDGEAGELFELAHHLLRPGGRLITYDGCYKENQPAINKFILDIDRGKYVRTETAYKNLAASSFKYVSSSVREDLFNIPYTLIIMECKKY
jgi:SAM-dependent methyltransferase